MGATSPARAGRGGVKASLETLVPWRAAQVRTQAPVSSSSVIVTFFTPPSAGTRIQCNSKLVSRTEPISETSGAFAP